MSNPFEGDKAFSGRSRISEQKVKIEAAKEALLDHLKSLGSPSKIAIICFHSEPSLIFSGLSNEITEIQNKLNSITADGETNIAVALDEVRSYVAKVKGTSFFRTLVISDGLSELEPARQSASRLVNQVPMSIDVILIDRTDPGEEVARAIALNGSVSLVTTDEALADQIGTSASTYSREVQEAGELIKENELSAFNRSTGSLEKLAFTASYPSVVTSGTWYSLLVYLHLAGLQNEIEKLLAIRSSQLGVIPARSTGQIAVPVQRETILKLVPHLEGFEFNPASQEIKWYEDIQEINFRLCADANSEGKMTLGSVDVYVGACLVALIPLAVTTRQPHDLSLTDTSTATTVERFESIFISYSHRDTEIIDACVAAYDALGIEIYIDKDRLKSGYNWNKALQKFIDEADLFQLYWSEASSKSIYVEEEWRYALGLVGRPSKGERFIRPLRWEDPCPELAQELSHLHFATLDLQTLFRQRLFSKAATTLLPVMSVPKLQTTVISTLPIIPSDQTANIRENMVQVVEFLEQVTQLRYYPVSTLLVDEYLVKSVRSATTIDIPSTDTTLETEISELSTFLGTVCLGFHVREFRPANLDYDGFDEKFGLGSILNEGQYRRVRVFCEGRIINWIADRWQNATPRFRAVFPNIRSARVFSDFALAVFDRALELAQNQHSSKVRSILISTNFQKDLELEELLKDATGSGVQVVNKSSYSLELLGNPSAFIILLTTLRGNLVRTLPRYDFQHQIKKSGLNPEDRHCLGAALIADHILQDLLRFATDERAKEVGQIINFHRWLSNIIDPEWLRDYAELSSLKTPTITPNLELTKFVEEFLGTITRLMERGLQNLGDFEFKSGLTLSVETWHKIVKVVPQNEIPKLRLDLVPEERHSKKEFYLKGRFSDLIRVFKIVSKHLVELLSKSSQSTSPVKRFFVNQVPAYGIYSPANSQEPDKKLHEWSIKQGVPPQLTLPSSAKVLLCLGMQHGLEEQVSNDTSFQGDVAQIASLFQSCVLIHEHFHAILETGLDTTGNTSVSTSDPDNWEKALPLNESLAVWMELHFARLYASTYLQGLIKDYIQAGNYPDWPYRGAEYLEKIYQDQGLSAIQAWIDMIRKNPYLAQDKFDNLITQ